MAAEDEKEIQKFKKTIVTQLAGLKKLKFKQFSKRIANLEDNFERSGQQIIRSGLVGITSSGKSSLLNTILGTGTKILKEQSKATTNMIVFCSKGKKPELEIFFEDGKTQKKQGDAVLQEGSIWKFTSEDENPQNELSVKFIKLALPTFMLEEGLEIADTPGLDAFGHKEHEDLTLREFLPQANLIIYLASIRSPMKDTDRKILDKIMDADQRIIFVQTCKGAVVEQQFGQQVKRTVQEQLDDYREKFREGIIHYPNLKDAPIVQVETSQAMEYFKTKDKNAWKLSGLDEFIHVISETTTQIKAEFTFLNLRRLVDESLAINQLVDNTLKEEGDKASALESQKSLLSELRNCQEEITEHLAVLQAECAARLDFEAMYKKYHAELSELYIDRYNFNPMHDDKFLAKAQTIDDATKDLKAGFLDAIDGAKKRYSEMFTGLGLDVRRVDYQNVSKQDFFLPNVQKKRLADALGKKDAAITAEYVDKNKYIKDLEGSLALFFEPLVKHFEWWNQTMTYTFLKPLEQKIEALTEDIANVEKGISITAAQKENLTEISNGIETAVEEVLPLFDKGAIGRKIKAYSRYIGKLETISVEDRNIFLQLGNRLFENLFHSYYLQCLNDISQQEEKTVLLLGMNHESKLGFLRRLIRFDQDTFDLLLTSDPPFSINAAKKTPGIQNFPIKGEMRDISFYVLGNDEKSLKAAEEKNLFKKADVVQVIIDDLHRVASALRDLVERLIFFKAVRKHPKKLLVTYPAAAHFQKHKLHTLVDEVMVEVNRVFHPDRIHWFVYENFEARYGFFSHLAEKMLQEKLRADAMVVEWKERGLPLDEPFGEDVLKEQFEILGG